jgi:hypothetical protein
VLNFVNHAYYKDTDENEIHREQAHANMVQKFLAGNCVYTPAHILHSWYHSKDGRQEDPTLMFSTIYGDFSCLTLFAPQIIERRLVQEVSNAVKSSNGVFPFPDLVARTVSRSILSKILQKPSIIMRS